jgi:hypothetical protein
VTIKTFLLAMAATVLLLGAAVVSVPSGDWPSRPVAKFGTPSD